VLGELLATLSRATTAAPTMLAGLAAEFDGDGGAGSGDTGEAGPVRPRLLASATSGTLMLSVLRQCASTRGERGSEAAGALASYVGLPLAGAGAGGDGADDDDTCGVCLDAAPSVVLLKCCHVMCGARPAC
jgi:hypothetical protein